MIGMSKKNMPCGQAPPSRYRQTRTARRSLPENGLRRAAPSAFCCLLRLGSPPTHLTPAQSALAAAWLRRFPV